MGVLGDDTDPMVTVMKLEKAPQETYADIGGLDNQIQEIKVRETQSCYGLVFRANHAVFSSFFFFSF